MTSRGPSPALQLMSRPGCHLCDLAADTLDGILTERARAGLTRPSVVEVNIENDAALCGRYRTTIPVLVLGSAELPLARDAEAIRAFLAAALDRPSAVAD